MIATDNMYPNTARIFSKDFTGNADMPFDFFMSRYKEAYIQESIAFVNCLRDDAPSPCTGEDGLVALIMSIAAGKSAEEGRWVKFSEIAESVQCDEDGCQVVELFPDEVTAAQANSKNWIKRTGSWMGRKVRSRR